MKLPREGGPVCRRHDLRRPPVNCRHGIGKGIFPQDVWCEDVCHDSYPVGSREHARCLTHCRRD
jgi:hypothetical protein